MRVVVVGGGISGLTTALLAGRAGHEVVCVDSGAVPGGLIQSERHDGFLCEAGPQAVLSDAPDTLGLISMVGLEERLVTASAETRRRFIYARGGLHPLPMTPPALLRSGLLSGFGKLRLLAEPFVGRSRTEDDSETVAAFGVRRLGREAGRTLLNTAVIGIYAADADQLSIVSAFPRLAALEREHGSLFRGMLAARKAGKRPGLALSFPEGLGELSRAIAGAIGAERWARGTVTAVEPRPSGTGWRVIVDGAAIKSVDADVVVVTVDQESAARLLRPVLPEMRDEWPGVHTAPMAVCCLGFKDASPDSMGMDLAAYGFLVARQQGPLLLGCQYESSIFANRAPAGGVLLRAIMGGCGPGFDPGIVEATDDEIAQRAVADLVTVAGLKRQPDLARVWKYPRGIPLYGPGHAARVATLDTALRHHPGLFVIGHGLRGVGVNESIRAATALVRDQL